jgi:hypothetical protein
MKGDSEILTSTFSVLVFVGFIAAFVILAQLYFVNFSGVLANSDKDLLALDASHLVENCFKDSALYIQKENLDSWNGDDVCDIPACKLCGAGVGVKIEDLEAKTTWDFDYDEDSRNKHFIYVNIEDGDDVRIGRLHVSV